MVAACLPEYMARPRRSMQLPLTNNAVRVAAGWARVAAILLAVTLADGFNPALMGAAGRSSKFIRTSMEYPTRPQALRSSAAIQQARWASGLPWLGNWRGIRGSLPKALAGGGNDSAERGINGHRAHNGARGGHWNEGTGTTGGLHTESSAVVGGDLATAARMEAAAKLSVPLKVMVFVDGTWLYYSFFGRGERCHVSAKLGPGWYYDYRVKWEMLPVIISRALHAQLAKYNQSCRLVEVVRTVVFSSARKDTDKDSTRMQMFESMRDKNFEVHMATTMGVQEKCIDIALAVEMLHYATIPDTYDVGVLVTGDKDFMPAMARTRQKGRRVCLCSMHNSCNSDLLRDDAHVMDFPPVWINEHLDDLLEYAPSSGGPTNRVQPRVTPEELCDIVVSLIEEQGGGPIYSRDLGRALAKMNVLEDGTSASTVIKESWGSLTKFLGENDMFVLGRPQPDPAEPDITQYTISLVDRQNSMKSVKLGEVVDDADFDGHGEDAWAKEDGREALESLAMMKVPELKGRLRERGLPVSGNKAVLIERLVASLDEDQAPQGSGDAAGGQSEPSDWAAANAAIAGGPFISHPRGTQVPADTERVGKDRRVAGHAALVKLIAGILDAAGTVVSSRDVGRELSRLPSPENPNQSALAYLKTMWPTLMAFLRGCPGEFTAVDMGGDREFGVIRTGRAIAGDPSATNGPLGASEARHSSRGGSEVLRERHL